MDDSAGLVDGPTFFFFCIPCVGQNQDRSQLRKRPARGRLGGSGERTVQERGYRVLADLADMDIYYLNTMLDTTRWYLRAQRDQATRFIKGFVEGLAFFKKNKQESVEVLRKKLRTDPGREKYLELSYDLLAGKFYDQVPYPSVRGVETVLEFIAKDNPKARAADPRTFIDGSIVKEIEASGFVEALYKK